MNPIIASSLVNLGKDFVSSGINFLSRENLSPASKQSFAHQLQSAKASQSQDLEQLKKELLNDPELRKFLTQNEGHTLQLDKSANGSFRILSSSGDLFVIDQSSQCAQKAAAYHNLCSTKGKNLVPGDHSKVLIPS